MTDPSYPLIYDPRLENHHLIMSTIGYPGGRLERDMYIYWIWFINYPFIYLYYIFIYLTAVILVKFSNNIDIYFPMLRSFLELLY